MGCPRRLAPLSRYSAKAGTLAFLATWSGPGGPKADTMPGAEAEPGVCWEDLGLFPVPASRHLWLNKHLSCAPAPRLLPFRLGAVQGQVPLHLVREEDMGGQQR